MEIIISMLNKGSPMIKKIPLKSNNQLCLEGITFTKLPIKFSEGEDNTKLAKFIFSLFGDDFYLVISGAGGIDDHICSIDVQERLEYNKDMRDSYGGEENNPYPKLSKPNYQVLCKCDHKKNKGFGYDILKVENVESLNFFFSTGGDDNDISIFSNDYDVNFLSNIWFEILEYCWKKSDDSGFKFYEYLYSKYPDYVKSKKFALVDTYGEDEDSNSYLFISTNNVPDIKELNRIVMKDDWYKVLPEKLK